MNSMTAYSRRDLKADWGQASCELRTVNHRHLELSLRLDDPVRALEPVLRRKIQAVIQRGRLECSLHCQLHAVDGLGIGGLTVDTERLQELLSTCEKILEGTIWQGTVSPVDLLKWPGVLRAPSLDDEPLQTAIIELLGQTLDGLQRARHEEGQALQSLLAERVVCAQDILKHLREQLPALMEQQRARLRQRALELTQTLDAERLAPAVLALAQKYDITEELERLEIHLQAVNTTLHQQGPVGRRLDFLMQELHREANTLASKSMHPELTSAAMEIKVLTEQMREQAQNLE